MIFQDVHARYRTEAHQDVKGRFNERLLLSLATCETCMVLDDKLNLLPLSDHVRDLKPVPPKPVVSGNLSTVRRHQSLCKLWCISITYN